MHGLQSKRPVDLIALPAAVIRRRLIGNDARRDQRRTGRDTARPLPHRASSRQLSQDCAMSDHVTHRDIVVARIHIDEAVG